METNMAPGEDEALKAESAYLRGTITDSLADMVTGAVTPSDAKLLKFHGIYQQDDRDLRNERQKQKLEPAFSFLIRLRMPGGVCTPKQWLQLDDLAHRYGHGSLRITTRQTFQFHGVIKRHLKMTIAGINHALISTVAACGDVNRNVVCHNNPYLSPHHAALYRLAREISDRFLPATQAYHEIWLDGEHIVGNSAAEEPFYGRTYLPRKFKIGLALPPWNDVDVFSQDLGFIAVIEDGELVGFNVCVGGGMGMTHGDLGTHPRVADVVGYAPISRILEVAEQTIAIQRDFGDRINRRHARFKYTIEDRGIEWFRKELSTRMGWTLEEPHEFHFDGNGDRLGWAKDADGFWHLTLGVMSGRLRDSPEVEWLSALRKVAEIHEGDFRLTTNQNLIIARIHAQRKRSIEAILRKHRVPLPDAWTEVRRLAMSCVAFPTCGLAMAESERWLPSWVDRLETLLSEFGLQQEPISVRVSGCPNGCARPFLAEIGLVGKSPGRYNLYLGAAFDGSRLNSLYKESLNEDELLAALRPILEHYSCERLEGEHFGDFAVRSGYVPPIQDFHSPAKAAQPRLES